MMDRPGSCGILKARPANGRDFLISPRISGARPATKPQDGGGRCRGVNQGFGGVQDALDDLPGGLGIVLGDMVMGLLEVGQGQPGPA